MEWYRVVVAGKEVGRTPIKDQAMEAAKMFADTNKGKIVKCEKQLENGNWTEIAFFLH